MSPSPYFTLPFLLLVAIFQSTAAPRLTVAGARPDLMLLSVVSWSLLAAVRARELQYAGEPPSLLRGINDGVTWGFTGGLFLDLISGAPLGASALALMAAAAAVGIIGIGVSGGMLILAPLMAILGTAVYHLVFLGGTALAGRPVFIGSSLTHVILPSAIFNLALIPVVYILLGIVDRRAGRERLEW